jgi:phospholipid/cholesterol/gamma-HCH transport system permease protein
MRAAGILARMEEGALVVQDRLDRDTARALHDEVIRRLDGGAREVVLDLARVERADAFGAAALIESHRVVSGRGGRLRLENISSDLRDLLAFLRVDRVIDAEVPVHRREPVLARIGGWGQDVAYAAVRQANICLDGLFMTFIGPFVKRGPRGAHVAYQLDAIGAGSMGIVALISGLLGLIMALQAAYQLRQFGANIFVANLVGVAMTRELGPLITAIVLAARSGSAMAAELGTMVVTEEVDALKVMAIDPRRFLIAPRFAAMVIAMPLLAVLADVAGIFGGLAVGAVGLGISPSLYLEQTVRALFMSDVLTGLVKSFVFACVIAVISCQQGLSLRGGPEAVGRATTRAVVLSILIVIIADFCFTTLFFLLD